MIIVQKESGKLSQVTYYKADVEDFKKIGVWRKKTTRVYANHSIYFKIKLTENKNLKGIILGFVGYHSTYDHQFDILIEVQEYNGESWDTIVSKTIKFPPDWYYNDGSNYYYCDVPVVYNIEFETPITLDSTKQYRVRITPTEDIYITSSSSFSTDGTEYIYRILYSDEIKTYENGDTPVIRYETELDIDTIEYYDQEDNYYYDRYVSMILLNNGTLKVTNDSPEDIKLKGSIIITPSPNNGVYIGTETEPISKDKKITITLGYEQTSNYYGSPWQAVNDGFFIYTEKAEQEEAIITGFNSRHEIILDGILDKWNVGDEVNTPVDYPYPIDTRRTITSITYDTINNKTIITLNSDLPGDPLVGEKVFMLSQSVEIKGERPRYFTTAYESYVKYDKSQEVLKGVKCDKIFLSAKNTSEDSYIVMKNTYRVRGKHLGTLVFPSESYKTVETHSGSYIKRIVVISNSTINISEYDTLIDEIIAYNSRYGVGNISRINDKITINRLIVKSVEYAIGVTYNSLTIINEIEAYNVDRLFDMSLRQAGGVFKIGLLKGKCRAFGRVQVGSVVIEKTEELEPFDDPMPIPTMSLWRGYLDVRIHNIAGLSNTGMFSDGNILIVSTGDSLSDTTRKTGNRAYKVLLKYGSGTVRYTVPVLQENLPIALQLAVKFSDSFINSSEKYFKIRITMPDGNVHEKEVEDYTTDWQYVSVSGTSTTKGIAVIEYEMKADSDSYLYIDDEVLLTGYVIDMSGAETWQGGLPTYPPIKTFLSGLDVWNISLDALTIPNTTGSELKRISEKIDKHDIKMTALKFI